MANPTNFAVQVGYNECKQIKKYLQLLSDLGLLDEWHYFSFHIVLLPREHCFWPQISY